ncbi:hypothetical protein EV424DRAFT_1351881 [Suillus variegatus]|nr:hypothetical protein EV424DRAFT_1351881 [Suillus variegatus]
MTVSKEQIAGVTCYVATPTIDNAKDKVILLPDAFGVKTPQQLLADDFVTNGFKVVTIDYPDRSFKLKNKSLDFWGRLAATAKVTSPSLDKVIAALKEEGATKFGATGRHTFDLAFDNIIQCAVVSHLSLLNLPDDLEVTHIILVALSLHTWVTVLGDLSNPLVKTGNEGSSLARGTIQSQIQ